MHQCFKFCLIVLIPVIAGCSSNIEEGICKKYQQEISDIVYKIKNQHLMVKHFASKSDMLTEKNQKISQLDLIINKIDNENEYIKSLSSKGDYSNCSKKSKSFLSLTVAYLNYQNVELEIFKYINEQLSADTERLNCLSDYDCSKKVNNFVENIYGAKEEKQKEILIKEIANYEN